MALGILIALSVTGCNKAGADDGVPTANGASSSASPGPQDQAEGLQKFAQCMRENGVPEYPDPKINDNGGVQLSLPQGVDREKVDAAMKLCKQHLPNGGELRKPDPAVAEQLLKFAKCMRENGVPRFPDPDENGGIKIDAGPDLDPMSQVFKDAEKICAKHMTSGPGSGTITSEG